MFSEGILDYDGSRSLLKICSVRQLRSEILPQSPTPPTPCQQTTYLLGHKGRV